VNPSARPRILFVDHTATVGGAEMVLLDVVRHHAASSAAVLFEDGPLRPRLEAAGVPVHLLPVRPELLQVRRSTRWPSPATLHTVAAAARALSRLARQFDLVYANSQKAFVVAAVAKPLYRRPLLWHLHDLLDPEHFSRLNIRLDIALANLAADRVIAVSEIVRRTFVAQGGAPGRVRTVANGIDARGFGLAPAEVAATRAELGLTGPLVGSFSRICSWKGQHLLLEALPALPGVQAVLVGDVLFGEDAYARHLRDLAARLGVADRVHFLGPRGDVPRLMQAMDLIVHSPTSPEPSGRVAIEALLSARPLVAAAAGGTVEMVRHGETGWLFPPGSVADLAAGIAHLLGDAEERRRIGEAGRLHALRALSLDAMLQAMSAEISAAAERRGARAARAARAAAGPRS
jgi:glycosyltransferase involved in cell wall biosynthesis